MNNNSLFSFIAGFVTGYLLINVIDAMYSLFTSWVQVLSIKPSKIINEYQKTLHDEECSHDELSPAIGFAINNNDYCDCDCDE